MKRETLADAIKRAIAARKESRYVTAQGSGVDYAALTRFLSGERDIVLGTAEKLAAYLDLELRPTRKRTKPKGK